MAFLLRPLLATTLLALPSSSIAQSNPPTYTCPSQPAGTCSLRFTLTVFESIDLEYSCGKLPTALISLPRNPANPLPAIHDHTGAQISLAAGVCHAGLAIDSPLPWTVDIVASSYDGTPEVEGDRQGTVWVEFRYAGGVYGKVSGGGRWGRGEGGDDQVCVQFPCAGF